jgi:NADH dehydrogenase
MVPFSYWDRGTFAVIGRGQAVGVAFRRFQSTGIFAWLAWLFIHLLFLIGFRSKLAVLLNWAYSYLAFQNSARLITGPAPRLDPPVSASAQPAPSLEGVQAPSATQVAPRG